jgi:hypothetical protein
MSGVLKLLLQKNRFCPPSAVGIILVSFWEAKCTTAWHKHPMSPDMAAKFAGHNVISPNWQQSNRGSFWEAKSTRDWPKHPKGPPDIAAKIAGRKNLRQTGNACAQGLGG